MIIIENHDTLNCKICGERRGRGTMSIKFRHQGLDQSSATNFALCQNCGALLRTAFAFRDPKGRAEMFKIETVNDQPCKSCGEGKVKIYRIEFCVHPSHQPFVIILCKYCAFDFVKAIKMNINSVYGKAVRDEKISSC